MVDAFTRPSSSSSPSSSKEKRPAEPPKPRVNDWHLHSKAELDEKIATMLAEGYKPTGKPVSVQLERMEPFPMTLQRGRCYAAVLRFDDGFTLSEHAKSSSVALVYVIDGLNAERKLFGPGGAIPMDCPQNTGETNIEIQATDGSAWDKSHIHDLGTGTVTLQFYTKAVSEKELERQKAIRDGHIAYTNAFIAARERQEDALCTTCRTEYDDCLAERLGRGETRATCKRTYKDCAYKQERSVSQPTWAFCGASEPR
ncbi:MAG: hypothetical protein SFX73_30175 [Kofleriaceae bacterium]|nr:hypothetical protein [Kofleriaceae bacterium]